MERVSVAIPMDKEEDYFRELVDPLRQSNKFSKFLLDLIKAYYEDREIQALFADYVDRNDPFRVIREQIEEAVSSHQRTVMATQMMRTHIDAGEEQIKTAVAEEASKDSAGTQKVTGVETRLQAIEETLPQITSTLSELVAFLQAGGVAAAAPAAPAPAAAPVVAPAPDPAPVVAPVLAVAPPVEVAAVVVPVEPSPALATLPPTAPVPSEVSVEGSAAQASQTPSVAAPSVEAPVVKSPAVEARVVESPAAVSEPVTRVSEGSSVGEGAPQEEPKARPRPKGFDKLKSSSTIKV